MSDQQSDAPQADADAQPQAGTKNTSTDRESQAESHVGTISLDEAKKLRSEAANLRKRLKDAESIAQAAETKQREADETKAKEEGDYKRLLEEREKELAELKAEQANDRIARLREKYGAKERIPEELWTKIDGDDEDAIKADAKALAKHLGGPDAPEDDAGERSRENGKKSKKNDAYKDPSHWL